MVSTDHIQKGVVLILYETTEGLNLEFGLEVKHQIGAIFNILELILV